MWTKVDPKFSLWRRNQTPREMKEILRESFTYTILYFVKEKFVCLTKLKTDKYESSWSFQPFDLTIILSSIDLFTFVFESFRQNRPIG